MNRKEAQIAAINGEIITHPKLYETVGLLFDMLSCEFVLTNNDYHYHIYDFFQYDDGYEIMKEEKTITRFANFYDNDNGICILFPTKKEADDSAVKTMNRVACTKVKLTYFRGEGLNED